MDDAQLNIQSFTTSENESPVSATDRYYPNQFDCNRNAREFHVLRSDATTNVMQESQGHRRGLSREALPFGVPR